MKLFIWQKASPVSHRYHNNGGLAVIAETIQRAREMIAAETGEMEDAPCDALTTDPDTVRECEGPEMIRTFPNAGCC